MSEVVPNRSVDGLRVLFVGSFGFPFGSASAARIRYLATGLVESGAQVEVISQVPILYRPEDLQADGTYSYRGVRYRSLVGQFDREVHRITSAKQILLGVYRTCHDLRRILEHNTVDILLGYSWNAVGLEPIIQAGNHLKIPVVLDVVEWPDSFYFKGGYLHPMFWSVEWCMRRTNFKASALIVISSYLLRYYTRRGVTAIRIPAITDVPQSPPPKMSRPADSPFVLMYVGSPILQDGILDMLEAVRLLLGRNRAVALTVVGDHGRGTNELMEEFVSREPLMGNAVHFTGWVPQEKVPEYLAQSDALVLARRAGRFAEAGFPTKLTEYTAAARPVIVTSVGDIPEYVCDGLHGVVIPPNDPVALAEAVEHLMDLPDGGVGRGIAAWARAAEVFDYRVYVPRLLEFLYDVVYKSRETRGHRCS